MRSTGSNGTTTAMPGHALKCGHIPIWSYCLLADLTLRRPPACTGLRLAECIWLADLCARGLAGLASSFRGLGARWGYSCRPLLSIAHHPDRKGAATDAVAQPSGRSTWASTSGEDRRLCGPARSLAIARTSRAGGPGRVGGAVAAVRAGLPVLRFCHLRLPVVEVDRSIPPGRRGQAVRAPPYQGSPSGASVRGRAGSSTRVVRRCKP